MHFTLTDFLLDTVQNSLEAGAQLVEFTLVQNEDSLVIHLRDNGRGMTKEELARATDPFYTDGTKHKARKVGLGIPFLIQTVEMTEGLYDIKSEKGKGTEVDIRFNLNHWDTPPVGDLVTLFYQLLAYPGGFEMVINRSYSKRKQEKCYCISRHEMIEILGDLEDAGALTLLRQFIRSQEDDLLEGETENG